MGHFLKDLEASQEAVDAIMDYLTDKGHVPFELEGKEQKLGDIGLLQEDGSQFNIEVKYDMAARRSGNLCFEMTNGRKLTGIMTSKADAIYYVVPGKDKKDVYVFNPCKLRKYIQDPGNVKMVNGGDRRRFSLALVPIQKVLDDGLPSESFSV